MSFNCKFSFWYHMHAEVRQEMGVLMFESQIAGESWDLLWVEEGASGNLWRMASPDVAVKWTLNYAPKLETRICNACAANHSIVNSNLVPSDPLANFPFLSNIRSTLTPLVMFQDEEVILLASRYLLSQTFVTYSFFFEGSFRTLRANAIHWSARFWKGIWYSSRRHIVWVRYHRFWIVKF